MKKREQAFLFLRKAAQDEILLDEVIDNPRIADEIIGFHCQQAAEKIIKALLSTRGVRFRKTHDLAELGLLLKNVGIPLPEHLRDLDVLTPFGVVYRYEDYAGEVSLDRQRAREMIRALRSWVEDQLSTTAAEE